MNKSHMANIMNKTNQVEACFDSLNEVRDRLVFSYRELLDYEEKLRVLTKKTKLPPKENFMIRILSETNMLNLYKFGEINNSSLNKILKELDDDFLKSTKKCLKPFNEMMPEIRKYRHFVAHSEKRSKKFLLFHDIDENFDNNFPKLKFLSMLVIFYIDCIFENFSDIVKNTELTRKLKIRQSKERRSKDAEKLKEYQNNIEIMIQDVNLDLEKNGFKGLDLRLYFPK